MTLEGAKIIAIDDTPSILTFLRVSLRSEGANFYEAETAEAGLKLCKEVQPDLVVLDLGLPDKNGLEILPEIKASQSGVSPAVVVLTVRKGREIMDEACKLGADAYLTKPFMVEDLLEVIEQYLA